MANYRFDFRSPWYSSKAFKLIVILAPTFAGAFFGIDDYLFTQDVVALLSALGFGLMISFIIKHMVEIAVTRSLLHQFAKQNDLPFKWTEKKDHQGVALLREEGNKTWLKDVVTIEIGTLPTYLFQQSTVVYDNRQFKRHCLQCIELTLAHMLPTINIVPKGTIIDEYMLFTGNLALEGDFNSFFNVDIVTGTQVSVLEVLSPEFMAMMIDGAAGIGIQVEGAEIVIWTQQEFKKAVDIEAFLAAAQVLVASLEKKAEELSSSQIEQVDLLAS